MCAFVERDGAHPGQPAEHAGALRAVHPAQLGDAQRQLPVGTAPRPEDQRVVRAERRTEHELVVGAQPHRREHVVGEVAEMAGEFEEFPLAQRRRVDVLVAGAALQLPDVLLDGVPGGGAGRQPDRQAGAGQRIGDEEVQLAAEPTVVDHVGLLDRVRPGGDLSSERRAALGGGSPRGLVDGGYVRAARRGYPASWSSLPRCAYGDRTRATFGDAPGFAAEGWAAGAGPAGGPGGRIVRNGGPDGRGRADNGTPTKAVLPPAWDGWNILGTRHPAVIGLVVAGLAQSCRRSRRAGAVHRDAGHDVRLKTPNRPHPARWQACPNF